MLAHPPASSVQKRSSMSPALESRLRGRLAACRLAAGRLLARALLAGRLLAGSLPASLFLRGHSVRPCVAFERAACTETDSFAECRSGRPCDRQRRRGDSAETARGHGDSAATAFTCHLRFPPVLLPSRGRTAVNLDSGRGWNHLPGFVPKRDSPLRIASRPRPQPKVERRRWRADQEGLGRSLC